MSATTMINGKNRTESACFGCLLNDLSLLGTFITDRSSSEAELSQLTQNDVNKPIQQIESAEPMHLLGHRTVELAKPLDYVRESESVKATVNGSERYRIRRLGRRVAFDATIPRPVLAVYSVVAGRGKEMPM